jgi:hypothetical protein
MNTRDDDEKKKQFQSLSQKWQKAHKRNDDEQLEDVTYQKKITFHCYYVIIHHFRCSYLSVLTHLHSAPLSPFSLFLTHIISLCVYWEYTQKNNKKKSFFFCSKQAGSKAKAIIKINGSLIYSRYVFYECCA